MAKSLTISLKKSGQLVYYGGQFVEGTVNVDVSEELKATSIKVRLHGYANVHWADGIGSGQQSRTIHFTAKETYVDTTLTLLSPDTWSKEFTIAPGEHKYPFRFQIPADCPTSYESRIGQVRYILKATIDRPRGVNDTYQLPFTVLRHLDLNTDPYVKNNVSNKNSINLCCLCCKTGPITGKMTLDSTGYVPGEAIQMKAEANNGSNRSLNSTSARIAMSVSYITARKIRTVSTDIAQIKKGKVQPRDSEVWYGEKLVVPPVPPSGLPGCNIIDIRYYVIFTVAPSGPAFDLDVPVKITIGTIPLEQVVTQYGFPQKTESSASPPPMPSEPLFDSHNGDPSLCPPSITVTPALPPPSYSESVFGPVYLGDDSNPAKNLQDRRRSSNTDHPQETTGAEFTPMYTYYNWNQVDPNFKVTSPI